MGGSGCTNTDPSVLNEDASGYVCNNTLGIKGAWYCYSDGADSTISCKGSDGKGMGAIPWNSTSSAMCLSGTMGTGSGSYAGIGFKVNSGPPGSTATPGTWNAYATLLSRAGRKVDAEAAARRARTLAQVPGLRKSDVAAM